VSVIPTCTRYSVTAWQAKYKSFYLSAIRPLYLVSTIPICTRYSITLWQVIYKSNKLHSTSYYSCDSDIIKITWVRFFWLLSRVWFIVLIASCFLPTAHKFGDVLSPAFFQMKNNLVPSINQSKKLKHVWAILYKHSAILCKYSVILLNNQLFDVRHSTIL
jgi:hypothetical protein